MTEIETLRAKLVESEASRLKWKAIAKLFEVRAGLAENKLAELRAENLELRRTHAGGPAGVEMAELQAQNNALRLELGELHAKNRFQNQKTLLP